MGGFRAGSGAVPLRGIAYALRRIVAAIAVAALAAPVLSGWKVTGTQVRYAYYPVSGRDHAEIVRSVRRFAPRAGRAYGIGFIDFYPDYQTTSGRDGCRISAAETACPST